MRMFRELVSRRDDNSATKDAGDLYSMRPSPRKIRLLIDLESVTDRPDTEADSVLQGLCGYDNVETLVIEMSKVRTSDEERASAVEPEHQDGSVVLTDVTAHNGPFSLPGPRYLWEVIGDRPHFDRSVTTSSHGWVSPLPQLTETYQLAAARRRSAVPDELKPDIDRAVLLAETGRAIDYDLVVSEAAECGGEVAIATRANVVTRAQAIPIVAHYLRCQQVYPMHPVAPTRRHTMNRQGFYIETVYACSPGLWHWLGKCEITARSHPESASFLSECHAIIGRLSRALRARDSLMAALGAKQTPDAVDDGLDALDHALLSLCGAVDVLARSLHSALKLPEGQRRHAKLHARQGYNQLLKPFPRGEVRSRVDAAQAELDVVFKLRNTIHSEVLDAIGATDFDPNGTLFPRAGELDMLLPDEIADAAVDLDDPTRSAWGISGQRARLDALLDQSFATVFTFIDHLCRLIAAEFLLDRDPVLYLDVLGAQSPSGADSIPTMRHMIGLADRLSALPVREGFPVDLRGPRAL